VTGRHVRVRAPSAPGSRRRPGSGDSKRRARARARWTRAKPLPRHGFWLRTPNHGYDGTVAEPRPGSRIVGTEGDNCVGSAHDRRVSCGGLAIKSRLFELISLILCSKDVVLALQFRDGRHGAGRPGAEEAIGDRWTSCATSWRSPTTSSRR
jgi:hypothetical protein